jgi:hypothetical protein
MTSELERLSNLGSNWASATLGYLSLLPSREGKRDPERAIEQCSRAVAEGDPYSLFVVGWAGFLLSRNRRQSVKPMLEASNKGFVPATLAMAFFVWPDVRATLDFVEEAQRARHKAAWVMRCAFYCTGRLGSMNRLLGYAMTLPARLRFQTARLLDPLSLNVLVFNFKDELPAFRSAH